MLPNELSRKHFLQAVGDHPDAWPFKEPVNARDVPDYYEIIKDPMGESADVFGEKRHVESLAPAKAFGGLANGQQFR